MTERKPNEAMYGGMVRMKYVDSEKQHAYYVSWREGIGWTDWRRVTGVTTFIGIKDKSTPIKFWVARIMYRFLLEILSGKRDITKFDLTAARELHMKKFTEAASFGDKTHDWIEQHVKGKDPAMPQEELVLQAVNAFLDLEKQQGWKWIESEKMIYHESRFCEICKKAGVLEGNEYAGRLDLLARKGRKLILPDVKTSNGIYNEVMLQTAAYAHAVEAMGMGEVEERWELRLEKRSPQDFEIEMDEKGKVNAKYKPFEALLLPDTQDADFAAFLHFREGYLWNKSAEQLLKQNHDKN